MTNLTKTTSKKSRQWLWFFGLYVGSIVVLATITYLVKWLIPHFGL